MSLASKITRRSVLAAASAGLANSALARVTAIPALRGGNPAAAVVVADQLLHTFQVQEVNGSASAGLLQVGLPIAPGTVMPGTILELRRSDGTTVVPAQFDHRRSYRYTSEGLSYCVAFIADPSNFSANETRTYRVYAKAGSWANATPPTPTAANAALAAALAGHSYNIYLTSVVGGTSGALSPITVAFNAAAALTSRTTQYQVGAYINSWEVWIETSHPQLILTIYYSQIKNSSGTVVADQIVVEPGMFWWDVAKEKLIYNAELRDSATSLVTYTSVNHCPLARWYMLRTQNDNQHAAPIWNSAGAVTIPTLMYKPDQTAWKASGLVPRFDTTLTLSYSITADTYIPGRAANHRYGISGVSAFMGEGMLPNSDIIAFVNPSATNTRKMLVNGLVGGHVAGWHCHSREVTTKPGKSADKANTVPTEWLQDARGASTPLSYSDFTADGMPVAQDYYRRPGWETAGYVVEPAVSFDQPDGGFENVTDNAHNENYSYYAYLLFGHRHLLNAVIDCGHSAITRMSINQWGAAPAIEMWNSDDGVPIYAGAVTTRWRGIGVRSGGTGVQRAQAKAHLILSAMTMSPDGEVQTAYLDNLYKHQAKYSKASVDVLPPEANGTWSIDEASQSGFMYAYCTLAAYFAYDLTRLSDMHALAEYLARFQIQFPASNLVSQATTFHYETYLFRSTTVYPNPITNPFHAITAGFWMNFNTSSSLTGNTLSSTASALQIPWTNGDVLKFSRLNDPNGAPTVQTLPPEVTAETVYYVVNASGADSSLCQFSATPGGAAIVTSANNLTVVYQAKRQAASDPTKWLGLKNAQDYGMYQRAAFLAARHHAHPLATAPYRDRFQAMYGAHPVYQLPWLAYEVL